MSSFSEELCEASARMNLAALSALLLIQAPVSSHWCSPQAFISCSSEASGSGPSGNGEPHTHSPPFLVSSEAFVAIQGH